jgi:membrane-bound lytic murein transglycosylase B
VRGYLMRGVVSAGSLVVAVLAVLGLAALAAPLPEETPLPADRVAAVPAALPAVPVPAGSAGAPVPVQPGPAPAEQPGPPPEEPPPGPPQQAYARWAAEAAPVTGVPERALQAYAYAHTVIAETQPGCGLTWVTLAGIAHIESNHGRFQGRMLGEDGRSSTPIIGIPLNGGPNARAIGDTDGGQLDGDQVWDRAIGPFQFIPSSWARWRSDGDGDGVGEPQDIDDSAVAAARYLCAGNRDLSTGAGWQRAILSYNNSAAYVQSVYATAEGYARDAQD